MSDKTLTPMETPTPKKYYTEANDDGSYYVTPVVVNYHWEMVKIENREYASKIADALNSQTTLREELAALKAENERLKIEASNFAYQGDLAKYERNKAETENAELRKALEEAKRILTNACTTEDQINVVTRITELLKQA